MPMPDREDFREAGRKLFAAECGFIRSVTEIGQLPPPGPHEIAFAGRSNVGKSSLINALTGHKALARISRTPGRTQALNFFALGGALRLVDLPGYGYAAAPREEVGRWTELIQEYLRVRARLLRVFVLVDGRHGLQPADLAALADLDRAAVSYQVVLTKADGVKPGEREQRLTETEAALAKRPAAFPEIIFTSAAKGEGIAELRAAIARLLAERAPSH